MSKAIYLGLPTIDHPVKLEQDFVVDGLGQIVSKLVFGMIGGIVTSFFST